MPRLSTALWWIAAAGGVIWLFRNPAAAAHDIKYLFTQAATFFDSL